VAFRAQLDDFATLYERTYQPVFRTVLGICGDRGMAADLTQDAFVAAYRQQATFRGDVPIEAWLHRIAVNTALSGLRRRRVRWSEPLDPLRHDRPTGPGEPAAVGDAVDIEDALQGLAPRPRAAVVLRYYHDFDYATIAAILGTSPGNVGSMLSRALAQLRSELDPDAGDRRTATTTTTVRGEAGNGD
jgi:RNA polymerase sigma factor (sigma-70 family)